MSQLNAASEEHCQGRLVTSCSVLSHPSHLLTCAGIAAAAASQNSLPVSQRSIGSPRSSQKSMHTSTRRSLGGLSKRERSRRPGQQSSIKRDASQKGMVLPFDRMNMAFHNIFYSVNLPSVSRSGQFILAFPQSYRCCSIQIVLMERISSTCPAASKCHIRVIVTALTFNESD